MTPRRAPPPRRSRFTALTVADIGERGLLARIAKRISGAAGGVIVGIGDDAAVLHGVGPDAVFSTDMLVEGVDFDWRWATAADVGHKAAAANLSDLAAMGARPRACLLSLALRPRDRVPDVLLLLTAMHRVGSRYGAPLVGGDLSGITGPLVASVTVIGETERGRALLRHHGRPGDVVLVSGELGGAAAGLELLRRSPRHRARPALPAIALRALMARQLRPTPRVELGRALLQSGLVTSCADVSDGIASDAQLLAGPGCAVVLAPDRLPVQHGVREVASVFGLDPIALATSGGEDFELVFSVPPKALARVRRLAARLNIRVTAIGEIVRGRASARGQAPRGLGFEHFVRQRRAPTV